MPDLTGYQIGEMAWDAIQLHSNMAGELHAPEFFIQSNVALNAHLEFRKRARLELPLRTVLHQWNVDQVLLSGLGVFRIDLAIFKREFALDNVGLETFIEFKLWTNKFSVARDAKRIKQILNAAQSNGVCDELADGFVVVCPQYQQGFEAAKGALAHFCDRFSVCYKRLEKITASNGRAYGVAVAVVDVSEFDAARHGT